ncbi:MAG: FAD-binding oxidoreductase [Roseovarius sp.]|nr:FAD-binding oxidoreductase [Roseovarius sp.]
MTQIADLIIIGGGIAGISAAARLAPHAKIVVLEGEPHLAYHSTGRSAAIFIRNYGNAILRALNGVSYAQLAGDMIGDNTLSPRGELLLVRAQDHAHLETYMLGADGVDQLTPAEACAMVPALKRDQFISAVYEADAQDIDVDLLVQGCARMARGAGAQIVTSAPVTALRRDAQTWQISTPNEIYEAPIVINAAGAWADRIADMAGVPQVGLQPMRRSAVMMGVPAGMDVRNWPLFGGIAEDWYAKPDGDRLMISPADADPVEPQDAWPDDMVLAEGLFRFEQMVDISVIKPSHSWAGLRSFVPDDTPVCGFDSEHEGFFWLAGQGGYGVQTSPALSRLTADLVLQRESELSGDVLAGLSPARFR